MWLDGTQIRPVTVSKICSLSRAATGIILSVDEQRNRRSYVDMVCTWTEIGYIFIHIINILILFLRRTNNQGLTFGAP